MTLLIASAARSSADKRKKGKGRLAVFGTTGKISLVIVVIAILLAVVGPWITPHNPTSPNLAYAWIGPDATHWLGYDAQGRDVLSRILAGARSSMAGPLIVVIVCIVLGTLLALVAAWRGGLADTVISSGMDILFAFPAILLAALAAAVFGPGLIPAVIALTIAYTPYVARLLRSAMLQARNQPYIAALEVQGSSVRSIWFKHLLPNVSPLIVAQSTILFGYAMLDIAILSYLGLGIQPPAPDWGLMISENQRGILQGYPMPALAASVCIVAVVVSMNVLGERLLDANGDRR